MTQMVFLLEEPSMKALLDGFLPKVVPQSIEVITIPHEGKSDLEKSIPRKLRAWRMPDTRFFIVRDQDAADCRVLKRRLVKLTKGTGRTGVCVRIACRELESWILSDTEALAEAFEKPALRKLAVKDLLRNPDALGSPSQELKKLVPGYQKVSGARAMGPRLEVTRSSSDSFRAFVSAVEAAVASLTPTDAA
jgi:Domain of unknown function (DUF4276)